MEFTFQQSPWAPLFLNAPFLFPPSLFTPDNYVHWTQTLESHIYTANLPDNHIKSHIYFCVRKKEIKVEVEESKYLIIRTEEMNEEIKPAVSFRRKFRLPGMIDIGSISAGYEDGVFPRTSARRLLHIHLSDLPGRHEILAPAA
ncbi:hypothetical protein MKW98_015605 [Papaver atlanticum]|uniref:SHSP domain-containing protein n=1 Tax=Papaver atlanticum TaxID=357466 RepID=A0AAD4S4J9_9MAGN|nr:hypothetical protein MKW98_015605 [Papaver atlanticum]